MLDELESRGQNLILSSLGFKEAIVHQGSFRSFRLNTG